MSILQELQKRDNFVVTIAGMRGQGKTFLASRFFEIISPEEKTIYIDIVGSLAQNLKRINPDIDILTTDTIISSYEADKIFYKIFEEQKVDKLVFDVSILKRQDAIFMVNLLFSYLIKRGLEYAILIDEVGELIPQNHIYYSEETERLIRIGRNKGLKKVILTTQRLQQVDKTTIAQSNYYIFFKMVHNLDLNAIREILGMDKQEFGEIAFKIKKLGTGCFIISDGVKWEGIYSFDTAQNQLVPVTDLSKFNIFQEQESMIPEEKKEEQKTSIKETGIIEIKKKKKKIPSHHLKVPKEIREQKINEYFSGKKTLYEIAEETGVSTSAVWKWVNNKRKTIKKTKKRKRSN